MKQKARRKNKINKEANTVDGVVCRANAHFVCVFMRSLNRISRNRQRLRSLFIYYLLLG